MTDNKVPKHIGIILDGNRRWAKAKGLPTFEGHAKGAAQIEPVLRRAFESGVEYVSLFVFSTENWKRTEDEVGYLMKLFLKYFKKESQRLIDEGICVKFLGRRDSLVRKDILKSMDQLEETSVDNKKGTVVFCFNYGGQTEIVDAARKLIESGVSADEVDAEKFARALYHPDVPACDFIIRTSGEMRLSGFNLWRSAYAELMFVDKLWPDFSADDVDLAIEEYQERNRRFGGN